jgi:hypothetical protein
LVPSFSRSGEGENLALRQQLAILHHMAPRARLRRADRAFRVSLARVWDLWRSAPHSGQAGDRPPGGLPPRRHRASLHVAGSGWRLRRRIPAGRPGDRYPGDPRRTTVSLAEPLGRESHRIDPARMPGPLDHPRRTAPKKHSDPAGHGAPVTGSHRGFSRGRRSASPLHSRGLSPLFKMTDGLDSRGKGAPALVPVDPLRRDS